MKLDCGTTVLDVFATQVESITVKHEVDDIIPQIFEVETVTSVFNCEMVFKEQTLNSLMKGTQFPLISNTCTTGHKLQGCTCDQLLVNAWHYGQNWAYVVLSRLRKMLGLYLREPLTLDLSKYAMSELMVKMLNKFRSKHLLTDITLEDYFELLEATDCLEEDEE